MALPCSYGCSQYHDGCHKTCPQWSEHRKYMHDRSARIRAYLKENTELTGVILQQLNAMSRIRKYIP